LALADTAKLVAALELDSSNFNRGFASANRSLSNFSGGLTQTGRGIGQLGAGVGRVATSLLKLGVAGAAAVGGFVALNLRAGIEQVKLLELATTQTNAVLASTKGVAGQTAESIRRLAEKYEDLNATIDDKVIQSGENLLLTFLNIRKEAFEPALQAALNMNQALGGGEEGLQGNIIRLGKALNDPIRGITALRRVGVAFSDAQVKQIKQLVAENNLFGAQQIILAELTKEFGGSFAAAGNTAAGRMAHLHDTVQDLQRSFAGPFASVLDRIVGKLGTFLGEASTTDAVTRLGSAVAGLFTDEAIDRGINLLREGLGLLSPGNLARIGEGISGVFSFVKSIDFGTIASGLKITASIAKTAIDAFLSLPPEVQSIAIAALAANKLSGGLIGSGLGNVAGGLLRLALGSLKTITAGNVTVVGANVTGGGVPGVGGAPAAGGGTLATAAKFILGPAAAVIIGSEIAAAINAPTIKPAQTFETGVVNAKVDSKDLDTLTSAINGISDQQNTSDILAQMTLVASNIPFIGDALGKVGPELEQQRLAIEKQRADLLNALPPKDALAAIDKTLQGLRTDDSAGAREQVTELTKQRAVIEQKLAVLSLTVSRSAAAADSHATTAIAQGAARTVAAVNLQRIAVLDAAAAERGHNNALLAAQALATQQAALTTQHVANAERLTQQSVGLESQIAAKNFSPSVRVTAVTNLTVSNVLRTLTSSWIAGSISGSGPLPEAGTL
jgi:hypothetical protein